MEYIAHKTEDGRKQSIKDHLEDTSTLAAGFAVDKLKPFAGLLGMIHDIGKYAEDFQKHISGSDIRFEHAICGAIELHKLDVSRVEKLFIPMLEYCIAGHHTGLPDGGSDGSDEDSPELQGRLKRAKKYIGSSDYSIYKKEIEICLPDFSDFAKMLTKDLKKGDNREYIERYAFFTRYLFSCLTDADYLDTERFFLPETNRKLKADFKAVTDLVDNQLDVLNKKADTKLQKARRVFLEQSVCNCKSEENILLLNMPTGSGKTLCSLKTALDILNRSEGKIKRIIYVIPYTSIIEQTAEEFSKLFGEQADILQHHSNYFFDTKNETEPDTAKKLQLACENWDSPFVITTSVQFFQSLYHYKGSGLRKLHNMAGSVIVFDEIHLLPLELLQPCLRGVGYVTKYLGSKAIFLSATMPDHSKLFEEYLPGCRYKELISDRSDFALFKKCSYTHLGKTDIESVISKAEGYTSTLIVVNSRRTAKEVYSLLGGNKYHLSTYMTPYDRSKAISSIRKDLENKVRVTVVSTSLIEAGVDLDFEAVFRQLAGLDSILQSGGRCNREGRLEKGEVFIFETDEKARGEMSLRTEITTGLLREYDDITSLECIREYYNRLFYNRNNVIDKNSIADEEYFSGGYMNAIPFRTYAEHFKFINDDTVAVVIDNCDESRTLLEGFPSDPRSARRKLQRYSVILKYFSEFVPMAETGRIEEKYPGLFVLTDTGDYSTETGILIDKTNDIIFQKEVNKI